MKTNFAAGNGVSVNTDSVPAMGTELLLTNPSSSCDEHGGNPLATTLVGRCVEVGDNDEGQPHLIIHTTREQLKRFGRNLAYVDVRVTLAPPNCQA